MRERDTNGKDKRQRKATFINIDKSFKTQVGNIRRKTKGLNEFFVVHRI